MNHTSVVRHYVTTKRHAHNTTKTYIPTLHVDLALFEDLDIKTNRWHRLDGLSMCQYRKKRRFPTTRNAGSAKERIDEQWQRKIQIT
jgi:hypothetical protein